MNYILIAIIVILLLCLFKKNSKEQFKCENRSFSLNNYIEDTAEKPKPKEKKDKCNTKYIFSRPNKIFANESQILKSGCIDNINIAFPSKCFSCERQSENPYHEGPTKCFDCM